MERKNTPRAWDAESWLKMFRPIWDSRDRSEQHRVRADYYRDHIRFVMDRCYLSATGKRVDIPWDAEDMLRHTKMYRAQMHPSAVENPLETRIECVARDCLVTAKRIQEETPGKTAVLNLANRYTPGGGVRTGSGAQEESCFLRSNYFTSLYPFADFAPQYGLPQGEDRYPMDPDFGGVWSENITVFRGRELEGYPLLDEPWQTNFIAVAALNGPSVIVNEQGETRLRDDMAQTTVNKIRTVYNIAIDRGVDNLVLGALGCGAFHNPPGHVAELFRQVLEEPPYRGRFHRIVFAIFDPDLAQIFADAFGVTVTQ